MSKGSKRRQATYKRMAAANLEIWEDGWSLVTLDPPGTRSVEYKRFYNSYDPDEARLYWRPMVDAINKYYEAGK